MGAIFSTSPTSPLESSSPSVTGRPVISPNPLPSDALSALQLEKTIADNTFLPGSIGYKENNYCWNWDAIGCPSVIFTPRSEEGLRTILRWYQSFSALSVHHGLSIHAGGHSHYSLKDHSVVIMLKHFNKKEMNNETKIGTFGAGLKLGDLDEFSQSFGLATPAGTNPDTGIAGLTLGGGIGHLSRQYGLTIDNVVGFRVMLSDGKIIDVTKGGEYDDLFWALRGGGGNFGIVLELCYQFYPRNDVIQGVSVFLTRQKSIISVGAETIIQQFHDYFVKAPREMGLMMPMPCGGPIVFSYNYTGDNIEEGEKLVQSVSKFQWPLIKKINRTKYAVDKNSLQWAAMDHQVAGNWYEGGLIIKELSAEVITILLKYTAKPNIPNTQSGLVLAQMGGKIDEIKENETPFLGRGAQYWLFILGKWSNCSSCDSYLVERSKVKNWVKSIVNDLKPYSKAGSYQTLGEAEDKQSSASLLNDPSMEWYGSNYKRLVEIKRKYDPNNIFRLNKNIDPNTKI